MALRESSIDEWKCWWIEEKEERVVELEVKCPITCCGINHPCRSKRHQSIATLRLQLRKSSPYRFSMASLISRLTGFATSRNIARLGLRNFSSNSRRLNLSNPGSPPRSWSPTPYVTETTVRPSPRHNGPVADWIVGRNMAHMYAAFHNLRWEGY